MILDIIQQTKFMDTCHQKLAAEERHPALAAEAAIRRAVEAAQAGNVESVHQEVEYAKYVLMTGRCGMDLDSGDLLAVVRSPGLALCSGLSAVSEMAQQGRLDGAVEILAEAAMRAYAMA